MRTRRSPSRLTVKFDDAEATRLRLIELQRAAELDFPSAIRLLAPAAVGRVVGMETVRAAEISQWLRLVEEGYFYELVKAAAKKRGDAHPAFDRMPSLDSHLRQYEDKDRRLHDFAERLLALSDEKRKACVVQVRGAPPDSEIPEFTPHRRGLLRGIGGLTTNEDKCDPSTHACVIQLALKGIGPTAIVRPTSQTDLGKRGFRHVWSLATERWIPYLWSGHGDPQKSLTALYVSKCARSVQYEYELWMTKAPADLTEGNPILRWLSSPSEPNRMAAINFALRHMALHYKGTPSGSVVMKGEEQGNDPAIPDDTGYVARPSDPSAYIPITAILTEHCDGVSLATMKEINRVLKDYPTNHVRWTRPWSEKAGRPHPQRRNVHLTDWRHYVNRLKNTQAQSDGAGFPDLAPDQIEGRKADVRRRRSGK